MLAAPWALLALLAIPVLVWIHRRRRMGVPVDVPSLLFLEEETAEATAPDRRRFDAELALSIAAALCLALAAAGPSVSVGGPKPVVRVVLDASPAMEARATPASKSPREQAEAAIAALGLSDVVVRARGKPADLLATARRVTADVRIVVSDRAITPAPSDVHVAAYGDPAAENVGIVAVHVGPLEGRPLGINVFVAMAHAGEDAGHAELHVVDDGKLVRPHVLAFTGASVHSLQLANFSVPGFHLSLSLPRDSLSADDTVQMTHGPLRVSLSQKLPSAHRRAVEGVLTAVLGRDGFRIDDGSPHLAVVTNEDVLPENKTVAVVWLAPLGPGQTPRRLSPTPRNETDPVLRGVDATGAECLGPRDPLLHVGPEDGLVEAAGPNGVFGPSYTWFADPLAGSPAPADTPAWPVFWANLVESLRGDDVGGGWRARGVLDPDVTRLGRDRIPIDPAWIANARTATSPAPKDLRLPLIVGGAVCLLLLWFAPRGRRVATVG